MMETSQCAHPSPVVAEANLAERHCGLNSTSFGITEHASTSLRGLQTAAAHGLDWPQSLEQSCRDELDKLRTLGVRAGEQKSDPTYFLSFGGEVAHDGNCLFTSTARAVGGWASPTLLRQMAVQRVQADANKGNSLPGINQTIKNLYDPDLSTGWGVHWVQEVKLILKSRDVEAVDGAIAQSVEAGMSSDHAAESVYKEYCTPVRDVESWALYMSVDGSADAQHRVVTMRYVQEGLLSVERDSAAAFGDDLAIAGMATELGRDIHVIQIHGADGGGGDPFLLFLPHIAVRGEDSSPPPGPATDSIFLMMKGTGWCGAGADHYEPLHVDNVRVGIQEGEEPAFTL